MQNKTSVFDEKVVTRFDKRNSDMAEKEHWWRKEYVTVDPKEEDPISEDSKKILSLRTLKRILSMRNLKKTLITVKPKDNAINENLQELQDPQSLLHRKLTRFDFLVMVYERVDDGDKFISFFRFLILLISAIIFKQRKLYKNEVTQSFQKQNWYEDC